MQLEEWRVCTRDDRYRVSNMGRVIGRWGRLLKPTQAGGGQHRKVNLGRKVHAYVHVLVLEAFVGPCPPGMECRHLNGNGSDNRLLNIEWQTHAINMKDKKAHGYVSACHKISFEAALEIKKLLSNNEMTLTEIARKYGCTRQNIVRIRNGEIHK